MWQVVNLNQTPTKYSQIRDTFIRDTPPPSPWGCPPCHLYNPRLHQTVKKVSGFFATRHLGLLGCNIVLMKHFLPLLILFLSACSQNIGNLSIVSTQPTNISNEYDSIGQIQGESKINTNTRHPRVNMTMINEAIQNALDISGADLITDATFELKNTWMFFFEAKYLVVTGEGWVKKKEGIKREKEIIEYDPDTGKPIYQ